MQGLHRTNKTRGFLLFILHGILEATEWLSNSLQEKKKKNKLVK